MSCCWGRLRLSKGKRNKLKEEWTSRRTSVEFWQVMVHFGGKRCVIRSCWSTHGWRAWTPSLLSLLTLQFSLSHSSHSSSSSGLFAFYFQDPTSFLQLFPLLPAIPSAVFLHLNPAGNKIYSTHILELLCVCQQSDWLIIKTCEGRNYLR